MPYRIYIDSFVDGVFLVTSPLGGQGIYFEDSDRFGPSKINPKSGDVSPIPDGLKWFWDRYPAWRKAGRPTTGTPMSTPIGPIEHAKFPEEHEYA